MNWDKETYKLYEHREFQCRWCNVKYVEVENVGRWECRQHPSYFVASLNDAKWTCCGNHRGAKGCVRADHCPTERRFYTERDDVVATGDVAWDLEPEDRAVVGMDTSGVEMLKSIELVRIRRTEFSS